MLREHEPLLENIATKKKKSNLLTLIIKMQILFARTIILRQQLVLVLCFYRVMGTGFLTNQSAYFLNTVF